MRCLTEWLSRVVLLVIGCSYAQFAYAGGLSDIEARRIAVEMQKAVRTAEARLKKAVAADDRYQYRDVVGPVQQAVKAWPADHLDNRAIFPYSDCRQYAISFLQIAHVWRRKDPSNTWQGHVVERLKADEVACMSALKSPDMSLKDI